MKLLVCCLQSFIKSFGHIDPPELAAVSISVRSIFQRETTGRMAPRRKSARTYGVEKLVAHKWTPNGFMFKVKWAGKQCDGKPWDDTWEKVIDVGEPLVDDYFSRIEQSESKIVTNVDIAPLLNQAREKVAHATAAARTKCRPRVHEIVLEGLTLKPLAFAFLDVVRTPTAMYKWLSCSEEQLTATGLRQLDCEHFIDSEDGVETWQVNFTSMKHVAAFCSFHSFMGCRQGVGALRYNIGRASNVDCMVVGLPMAFKVIGNRSNGLVTTEVTFATCWINGMFGTMTTPPQVRGMMRDAKHFNAVLAYAKEFLPHSHPLAAKGWKRLPPGVHTLPAHVAVPAGDSSDEE
mmetsp:Transcript_19620/g.49002  ORF Transcript_19620/g.49002 Transcript_19620/m.49002 type:complete len:348 (-) Transcript_19620:89-1132(-)